MGTYFGLYRGLFFLRLLLFRSSVQTHRRGLVEEPPRVERALRGGCSSFLSFSPTVIPEGDARAQVVPVETRMGSFFLSDESAVVILRWCQRVGSS